MKARGEGVLRSSKAKKPPCCGWIAKKLSTDPQGVCSNLGIAKDDIRNQKHPAKKGSTQRKTITHPDDANTKHPPLLQLTGNADPNLRSEGALWVKKLAMGNSEISEKLSSLQCGFETNSNDFCGRLTYVQRKFGWGKLMVAFGATILAALALSHMTTIHVGLFDMWSGRDVESGLTFSRCIIDSCDKVWLGGCLPSSFDKKCDILHFHKLC
jgi:hypothetical protein